VSAISRHPVAAVARLVLVISAAVVMVAQAVFGTTPAITPSDNTAAYRLSATALFMGGTNQPVNVPQASPDFVRAFVNDRYTRYVGPTGLCTGGDPGCTLVSVYTPGRLRNFDQSVAEGRVLLDSCIRGAACTATAAPYETTGSTPLTDTTYVVFGVSQSAIVAGDEKSDLIANPVAGTTVSFVLLSNPERPNGGLWPRFVGGGLPFLGASFDGATVTNSSKSNPLTTVDITAQYDGFTDFPLNPLNLPAVLNGLLGIALAHGDIKPFTDAAQLQGYYQDTTYYLQPASLVPLVMPLALIPVIGMPLARALDAPLRVIIEAGYDRTINPGQPTPAKYSYFPDPVTTLINFAVAIPTGWDDAITSITGNPANRPFHTAPQPVYGVGGPPVYAGAVDPYGPIDPSVAVAAAVAKPLVADSATRVPRRPVAVAAVSPASVPRAEPPQSRRGTHPAGGLRRGALARDGVSTLGRSHLREA